MILITKPNNKLTLSNDIDNIAQSILSTCWVCIDVSGRWFWGLLQKYRYNEPNSAQNFFKHEFEIYMCVAANTGANDLMMKFSNGKIP